MRRLTEEPVSRPSEGFTNWQSGKCLLTDDIWANVEDDGHADIGNKSKTSHLNSWSQCSSTDKDEVKLAKLVCIFMWLVLVYHQV